MKLQKTAFEYEEIKEFLDKNMGGPLIENCLVQYLLISFYSELEEKIKDLITNRINLIEDKKVAYFICKTNESMIKRVRKSDINDVLNKFGCGEGDVISEIMEGENLQPYFDAISNRHQVAHSRGTNMTLKHFSLALSCAEKILDAVTLALKKEH